MTPDQLRQALTELQGKRTATFVFQDVPEPSTTLTVSNAMLVPDEPDHLVKLTDGQSIYIIVRHILPQTATYVIISATLAVPSFIVAEAVLSLIGLGIQQPDPSWGNMLSLASDASILVLNPWLIWPPAILIVLTVLSFNLLGDGLRDALDPRSLQTYD